MTSRFSAARPKRGGENYARTHHAQGEPDNKKVTFDVRNPSALAAGGDEDEDEEPDAYLEADADVIRGSAATKRGAVNIDGYDSDSDREEMGKLHASKIPKKAAKKAGGSDDEDMDDMFAEDDDGGDDDGEEGGKDEEVDDATHKKRKEVKFLDEDQIAGQVNSSTSGGRVRLDDKGDDDSEDEEAVALAIQEEDVDDEVGAGGLKNHAPKVEAFNLKAEQEEGRFDQSGNFVRRAVDPDAQHDRWLDGLSKKEMRKAAEAHEKREADSRRRRKEDDTLLTADLLRSLILRLERGETALEALARLGRQNSKNKPDQKKKIPKWKQKKQQQKSDAMDVDPAAAAGKGSEVAGDSNNKSSEQQEPNPIKEAIDAITDAADKLLGRDRPDIYDREREVLVREWQRETDEQWVESERSRPEEQEDGAAAATAAGGGGAGDPNQMWEYRWTDGRDGADKQGPYDGRTMKAWSDAGYFGEGVEFRLAGGGEAPGAWSANVSFV